MSTSAVLLFCLGAIVACSVLVFVIETAVAFFVQDYETQPPPFSLAGAHSLESNPARSAHDEFELERAA